MHNLNDGENKLFQSSLDQLNYVERTYTNICDPIITLKVFTKTVIYANY